MREALVACAAMSDATAPAGLPMTTGLEIPGLKVVESLGVVYGLVVRSMGFTGSVVSSFKALRRGEISEYTQLLEDSRRHAIDRMVDNARSDGRRRDHRGPLRLLGDRPAVHRDRRPTGPRSR